MLALLCGGLLAAGDLSVVQGQCPIPPTSLNETAMLIAPNSAAGDAFGKSVFVDGDVAVIGAPGAATAFVYRFDGAEWTLEAELVAFDSIGTSFGSSVSVCGDVVVVGAKWSDKGAAFVFRFDPQTSTWAEEAKLKPMDLVYENDFGASVAVSGNLVVVGAPCNCIASLGKAYVYRFDGTKWIEEATLLASDEESQDRFGNSVSISGEVAVIGAYNEGNLGNTWSGTGAAYVYRFDAEASAWVEETKLISTDPLPGQTDQFGRSVSMRADAQVMVIGTEPLSSGYPVPVGSAYVFRYDPDACEGPQCSPWIVEAKLLASDPGGGDRFGYSVSISGDVIVAGAWGVFDDVCPFPKICNAGAAYIFRFDPDACDGPDCSPWIEQAKVTSSDIEDGDLFGWSVSVSNDVAWIGAWRDEGVGTDSGSAHIFGGLSDCNENGTLDLCDTADGSHPDENGNGVPDGCEGCEGDANGDGAVDPLDSGFVLSRFGCPVGTGDPNCDAADQNGDGMVDPLDSGFVLARFGPCQ